MQEKLKELELLVSQLLARQKDAQAQNAALKQRVRTLEEGIEKLKAAETELRNLREWKKNTVAVLRRTYVKLDKEIARAKEEENKIV